MCVGCYLQQALPFIAVVHHVPTAATEGLGLGLKAGKHELAVGIAGVGQADQFIQAPFHFRGNGTAGFRGLGSVVGLHGEFAHALQHVCHVLQHGVGQGNLPLGEVAVTLKLVELGQIFSQVQNLHGGNGVVRRSGHPQAAGQLLLGFLQLCLLVQDIADSLLENLGG